MACLVVGSLEYLDLLVALVLVDLVHRMVFVVAYLEPLKDLAGVVQMAFVVEH